MVMSPDRGGTFDLLLRLARFGLGGAIAGGRQYISWIHDRDFVRAVELVIADGRLQGPINLAAPNPLPQRQFMAEIRRSRGIGFGLGASRFLLGIAAFVLGTEPELLLKSRRVVPQRLLAAGFRFEFPEWGPAARDLAARWRPRPAPSPALQRGLWLGRGVALVGAFLALALVASILGVRALPGAFLSFAGGLTGLLVGVWWVGGAVGRCAVRDPWPTVLARSIGGGLACLALMSAGLAPITYVLESLRPGPVKPGYFVSVLFGPMFFGAIPAAVIGLLCGFLLLGLVHSGLASGGAAGEKA
jgi:Domain of unknown function (DUF1731)